MSNNLDAIEKLAELRDRGLLSDDEFEKQKKLLLAGMQPKSKSKAWRVIGWVLAICFSVGLVAYRLGFSQPMDDAEGCNEPSVQQRVTEIVNEQSTKLTSLVGVSGSNPKVLSVSNSKQLFGDKASGYYACVADAKLENGSGKVGYTIEWKDKSKGLRYIQMADVAELTAKYTPAATPLPTPAQPSAVASAVAPHAQPTEVPQQVEIHDNADQVAACVSDKMDEYNNTQQPDMSSDQAKEAQKQAEQAAIEACKA